MNNPSTSTNPISETLYEYFFGNSSEHDELERREAMKDQKLTDEEFEFIYKTLLFEAGLSDPLFEYSVNRGFLYLNDSSRSKHNVRILALKLNANDSCFESS